LRLGARTPDFGLRGTRQKKIAADERAKALKVCFDGASRWGLSLDEDI
jgi:hypothetical protein